MAQQAAAPAAPDATKAKIVYYGFDPDIVTNYVTTGQKSIGYVRVTMELSGNETIKQAVMAGMGISFLSAHAFQIEIEAEKMVILDMQDMPKMLDWCLLHRRNSNLSGVNGAFRQFVMTHGSGLTKCQI